MNRKFSFLDVLTPFFCVLLVTSNIVTAKFFDVSFLGITWSFNAGTLLLFPSLYIFGDILTEVWGYAIARRVIWTGFVLQALAAIIFSLAVAMPYSPYFDGQEAFVRVLGVVPALVVASLLGYFAGSFANSFIMARMKEYMIKYDPNHKWLPLRTITSTIVGELADTAVFTGIGVMFGVFPTIIFLRLTMTQWIVKTLIEIIMTPVTIIVTRKLKQYEGVDAVGASSYSPFKIIAE